MSLLLLFSSGPVSIAASDTAGSVDTVLLGVVSTETSTGADNAVLVAAVSAVEAASALDTAVVLAQVPDGDTAGAVETAALFAATPSGDAASGTDAAVLQAAISAADAGSALDAATLQTAVSVADSGVGLDAGSVLAFAAEGDTGVGTDAEGVFATLSTADAASSVDVAVVAVGITAADSASGADGAVLEAALAGTDVGLGVDDERVSAQVGGTDSVVVVETVQLELFAAESVAAVEGDQPRVLVAEQTTAVDIGSLGLIVTEQSVTTEAVQLGLLATDQAAGTDTEVVGVQLASVDSSSALDTALIAVLTTATDAASATEDASVLVVQAISAVDTATADDEALPSLPSPPRSVFEVESPSVVEILRSVTTRINGSARIQWLPLAQLVGGELFGLSPRRPIGEPVLGGQLAVRFDLHFVRPGAAQPAPPVAGFMPDRVGVLFADVSAVELLKAGDRVRCVSGPIDGTFEIRVIPDVAVGYSAGHHVEVEVVEVSQKGGGSYFDPGLDATAFTSFMRPLYDTRAQVLRRAVASEGAGSARESWPVISDIPDVTWGVPGEMWCRLSLRFLRRGKDQPPPLVAGRAPDRLGVLYCDVTPHLLAGDRVRCVEGPTTGTFELRVAPDLSPDLFTVHHLEMQVVEVAQALVGSYPRAGGG